LHVGVKWWCQPIDDGEGGAWVFFGEIHHRGDVLVAKQNDGCCAVILSYVCGGFG
jgi:hypothetical protein